MSGVLHPVGPESSETYWVRRALVVGVLLVLIIGLLIFLINLGGRPGQAAPAAATASTDDPAPTDSPAATDSASASPEPTSSTATGTASPSASPTPTDAASDAATATARESAGATPTPGAEDGSRSPSKSAEPTADSSPASEESSAAGGDNQDREPSDDAKSSKPRTADCDPADLRAKVTSRSRDVSTGQRVTFTLSVINKSGEPCTLEIDSDNYELKIYSGTDRIWSTNDCTKLAPAVSKRVKPGASVDWKTTWNGKRSEQGENCQYGSATPQPGYYYATSQLEGAKPAQFLLVLS